MSAPAGRPSPVSSVPSPSTAADTSCSSRCWPSWVASVVADVVSCAWRSASGRSASSEHSMPARAGNTSSTRSAASASTLCIGSGRPGALRLQRRRQLPCRHAEHPADQVRRLGERQLGQQAPAVAVDEAVAEVDDEDSPGRLASLGEEPDAGLGLGRGLDAHRGAGVQPRLGRDLTGHDVDVWPPQGSGGVSEHARHKFVRP